MAMPRKTLERIDIRRYWTGAVSDDAQMTLAFKQAGCPFFSPRQSLLLSPISMSWKEAIIHKVGGSGEPDETIIARSAYHWSSSAGGYAIPTSYAARAGLEAVNALTFKVDPSVGGRSDVPGDLARSLLGDMTEPSEAPKSVKTPPLSWHRINLSRLFRA